MIIDERNIAVTKSSRLIIVLYVFVGLFLPLTWIFPQLLAAEVSLLLGFEALVVQEQIVLRFSFGTVYRARVAAEQAVKILSVVAFVVFCLIVAWPSVFGSLVLLLLPLIVLLMGAVVLSEYGNIIRSLALVDLCFREVQNSEDAVRKGKWMGEALRRLREHAADFGLELDTSPVEKRFASRLFDHQDIQSELQDLQACLAKGGSISACLKKAEPTLRCADIFKPRKGDFERYLAQVEGHYQVLAFILALAALALKR